MNYLEVLLLWCALNLYMLLVAYLIHYPLIDFMIYFLGGVFLIIIFWYCDLLLKDPLNYGVLGDILKRENDKT